MTRTSNARLAGFSYLLYIAAAFPSMVLLNKATRGEGMAARLATMAQHASQVRLAAMLVLIGCFCALALAVSLYAITRDEDRDLAMLGLTCRVAEGVTGAVSIPATLALLAIATAAGADAPDAKAAQALGSFVLSDSSLVSATFFAVGSTLFSWLLLRGRMIPVPLAWLGVVSSALIVVALPLQIAGYLGGLVGQLVWIPIAGFELTVAPWLIIKGVAAPRRAEP